MTDASPGALLALVLAAVLFIVGFALWYRR